MDGVVADTSLHISKATNHSLHTEGLPPVTDEQFLRAAGLPLRDMYAHVTDEKQAGRLMDAHRAFQRVNPHLIQPFVDVNETLDELTKRGVRLAIVTGSQKFRAHHVLERVGLQNRFEFVITADDTLEHKPNPAPFLEAAKRLDLKPAECLVVGDGASDMYSGRAAGMNVARAMYGFAAAMPIDFKPNFEIHSIREVLDIV